MIPKSRLLIHTILSLGFFSSFITPINANAGVKQNLIQQPIAAVLPQDIQPQEHDPNAHLSASITTSTAITATAVYSITDLGTLGGSISYAWAINEAGQAVGGSYIPGSTDHAFLWQNGNMIDLGTLPGMVSSTATDINDHDQIVGVSGARAYKWQAGVMNKLPDFDGASSAYEINNLGHVVGYVNIMDPSSQQWLNHAAIWQNGSLTNLGTFGGEAGARAKAINDSGAIAITAYISPTVHALLLEGGVVTNLGNLGLEFSEPEAVNNHGQIVGYSKLASGVIRPFLWQGSGMIDLGTLGGFYNVAYDINDAGQVVGMSQTASGAYHAFLWEDDNQNSQSDPGELHDLNALIPSGSGWDLTNALGINENGQIIGVGKHDGQQRAYLLTPNQWTLMFYLDGDNNLGGSYFSIFNHLETVANTPGVNILVLWDNLPGGDSGYYKVQYNTNPGSYANYTEGTNFWSQGEVDMALPGTLSDFIIWGIQNFPSRQYALTLDDHGTGLGGGLCDTLGVSNACATGEEMNLAEIKLALATAYDATGEEMDVLNMAMCLMGMIEDAYQFRDYIDYYVANEHLQTVYTNYLPGLSSSLTPPQLADLLASNYAAAMAGKDYTISVAEVAQLPTLVTATDQLADVLLAHIDSITPTLTTIAAIVQRYDNEGTDPVIDTNDTYVDLYHLSSLIAQNLSAYPDIVSAAQAVITAVDAYILYEAHGSTSSYNLDDSHGVSIFFPSNLSSFYYAENNDFAAGTDWGNNPPLLRAEDTISWGQMLVEYIARVNPNGIDDPTPPEPRPKSVPTPSLYLPLVVRQ
jgi:probable HAF family extracellular repeat protein